MAEVTLTINGRSFGVSCDDGQEQRVSELGQYVDARLRDIANTGAANNESHLLLLTSLMLADEVFDLRTGIHEMGGGQTQTVQAVHEDEAVIAQAIDHLADRIDAVAGRIQKA